TPAPALRSFHPDLDRGQEVLTFVGYELIDQRITAMKPGFRLIQDLPSRDVLADARFLAKLRIRRNLVLSLGDPCGAVRGRLRNREREGPRLALLGPERCACNHGLLAGVDRAIELALGGRSRRDNEARHNGKP